MRVGVGVVGKARAYLIYLAAAKSNLLLPNTYTTFRERSEIPEVGVRVGVWEWAWWVKLVPT